ncbi:peptidase M41-like protein [Rhizobium sp. PP-F2F-G20b]|nr:peptidase M41-like protein [Rhizobium sp. PP-F2F-G20b]
MRRRDFHPTLKDYVYIFLMREAARRAGLLGGRRHCTTVFSLHPELSLDHVSTVLERVVLAEDRFNVASVEDGPRGTVDYLKVRTKLFENKSLVVVLRSDSELPSFLLAAADNVVPVGMISARHLSAALRARNGFATTAHEAEDLLSFPADDMFAALRPGRSPEAALAKLAAVRASTIPEVADPAVLHLEDLYGYGDAKTWGLDLAEDIEAWRSGRIRWKDIDTGVLLSGPPGTGKTLFAAALSTTCKAHFLPTSLAQWQSKGHLGDLLKAMRADFETAAKRAPCVMLIDEFDSIGDRSKFDSRHAHYSTEVVNALLECIDGSSRLEGVVVIGACNDPSRIDPALRRAGRLSTQFVIGLPSRDERIGMLRTFVGAALRKSAIGKIAELTEGFTGADLARLVRVARRSARKRGKSVSARDFLSELSVPIPIEGAHRRVICIHEAGHAIVGSILKVGYLEAVVVASTYNPAVSGPRGTTKFLRVGGGFMSRQCYLDQIAMLLGGMAAEEIVLGNVSNGSGGGQGSDLQSAADLSTLMQTQFGMGEALGHIAASTSEDLDMLRRSNPIVLGRVERLLAEQMARAKAILHGNRVALEQIASEADVRGRISGSRVNELIINPVI